MKKAEYTLSVFTKHWKIPIEQLGELISNLSVNAIELPIRPGYQVEPQNAARKLPQISKRLSEFGLQITSVAAEPQEDVIAACGEADIPLLRVLLDVVSPKNFLANVGQLQKRLDTLLPLLEKYDVTLGIQNHSGLSFCHALSLWHLIHKYESEHIRAVWDPAHCALAGETPELAADILWPYLGMVNLKNAYWRKKTETEKDGAVWDVYWSRGREGLLSWRKVIDELNRHGYQGVICLFAEYSDEDLTQKYLADDIAYLKSLLKTQNAITGNDAS